MSACLSVSLSLSCNETIFLLTNTFVPKKVLNRWYQGGGDNNPEPEAAVVTDQRCIHTEERNKYEKIYKDESTLVIYQNQSEDKISKMETIHL